MNLFAAKIMLISEFWPTSGLGTFVMKGTGVSLQTFISEILSLNSTGQLLLQFFMAFTDL
jgi:hypothetical protein